MPRGAGGRSADAGGGLLLPLNGITTIIGTAFFWARSGKSK
jgi:hypothetical protein